MNETLLASTDTRIEMAQRRGQGGADDARGASSAPALTPCRSLRRSLRPLGHVFVFLSLQALVRPAASIASSSQPTVRTRLGRIAGRRLQHVDEYLGIRYAAPPVRWAPAQDPEPWGEPSNAGSSSSSNSSRNSHSHLHTVGVAGKAAGGAEGRVGEGVFDATTYGAICVQPYVWWLDKGTAKMGEDCLWMNVWAPRRAAVEEEEQKEEEEAPLKVRRDTYVLQCRQP